MGRLKMQRGFGLIETVLGTALFVSVGLGVYQVYIKAFEVAERARMRSAMTALAAEEIETIRNLPYQSVGNTLGIPAGVLLPSKQVTKGQYLFDVDTTVRNIDDPFDGQIGSTTYNDLSPADSRLVEVVVHCSVCRRSIAPVSLTTRIAPLNLEGASTNGALFITVLDANGNPVEGAEIHLTNASSTIVINETTNASGMLQIIDMLPGVEVYQVTATKSGYTTERTYATGSSTAPNPVKTNPTIVAQSVTELTLTIDRRSSVDVRSVFSNCSALSGAAYSMSGSRLISVSPDVIKFTQSFTTNASGEYSLPSLEWDTYGLSDLNASYDLAGSIPPFPLTLLPGSNQQLYLVMRPTAPNSLLTVITDGASKLPIADARVEITRQPSGSPLVLFTGRGFMRQTNWSGGPGSASTTNDGVRYWNDDSVDVSTTAGQVTLLNEFGAYRSSGWIESSTFDTGSPSNFYELSILPQSQSIQVGPDALRLQLATGLDGTATSGWSFIGPDGTNSTYYTATNTAIASSHNGDRYYRYRAYFNTSSSSFTPRLEEVSVTFTSNCVPPGQAFFDGLSQGTYDMVVSKSGYQTSTTTVTVGSGWQSAYLELFP